MELQPNRKLLGHRFRKLVLKWVRESELEATIAAQEQQGSLQFRSRIR